MASRRNWSNTDAASRTRQGEERTMNENTRTILLALGEQLVLRARAHAEQGGATGCLSSTTWHTNWPLRLDKTVGGTVIVTAEGVGSGVVRAEILTDRE